MTTIRIGGLFEGYGGLTMGIRSVLGGELAWYSEIDEGALKILGHHHPDVPNLGDITAVKWLPDCGEAEEFPGCGSPMQIAADRKGWECHRCRVYWSVEIGRAYWPHVPEPVDVMGGGFPCQDVSTGGKQAGLMPGTRSGLWAHFAYAIGQTRPPLVVAENVRGLLSARGEPITDELAAAWAARDLATGLLAHLDNRRAVALAKGDTDRARHIATRRARVVGLRRRAMERARRADRLIARALATVLGSLADLGYDAVWHGLPASDVGAPHQRFRIFIFAWPTDQPLPAHLAEALRRALADGLATRLDDVVTLPTPRTTDTNGAGEHGDGGPDLRTAVALLPTPEASDGLGGRVSSEYGGERPSGAKRAVTLATAVQHRVEPVDLLLPTPAVNDMGEGKTVEDWDGWTDRMKAEHGNGNGHGKSLAIEAQRLLPTPRVGANRASRGALTGTSPGCVGRHAGQWSAPGLEQAVELAAGILPREYESWDEVRGASADMQPDLLPTPTSRDTKGHNQRQDDTCLTGALLPTPRATDGTKGGPNQRGSSGDLMLPSAAVRLMPTPTTMDAHASGGKEEKGNTTLTDATARGRVEWGDYQPAIDRWHAVIGRTAPEPTEPAPKGGRRLSARLPEWMMGLPDGHICDVPDITRNEALKAAGNGVVPQQSAAALLEVATWPEVARAWGLAA